jgi:LacI family transcriptional regulator, galactose operon repressor
MTLTLEQIAIIADVSRATVSRVINNDPNVSEKTRARVMRVIQELNFQPNRAARSLAGGRAGVIGLVIPVGVGTIFAEPFFSLLIQGVTSESNSRDVSTMLWLAEPDYERRMITKILYNGLVDGLIISSTTSDDPLIEAICHSHMPFVIVGRYPCQDELNYVDSDNLNGAHQAVEHLLGSGHQRIATISGPQNTAVGQDRYQGYVQTFHQHGLSVSPELVVESNFTDQGGYSAMQQLLPQRPDAVFVASDWMALGAMRALREVGVRVPEDIALVGFDDIPLASQTMPPLTTIRQQILQMGALASQMLLDLLDNPGSPPVQKILPTELVVRASSGPK